jgi:Mor family transcriptional regulator
MAELSSFTERFISQRPALRHLDAAAIAERVNTLVRDAWGGQGIYFKSSPQLPLFTGSSKNTSDQFLLSLLNTLQVCLTDCAVSSRVAEDLALTYINEFNAIVQGQPVYIRKLPEAYYQDRDAAIYKEFDGRNHLNLCRKYGFTMQRLYQILRRQQSSRRRSARI